MEALRRPSPQGGYTMAVMLISLTVLTLWATIAFRNTRTDIAHSKRSQRSLQAAFVAESAVNWAIVEASLPRGGLPYAKATHDPTGTLTYASAVNNGTPGRKLQTVEVTRVYPTAAVSTNANGWMCTQTSNAAESISGLVPEKLAFKIWYPTAPANSLRISAYGIAGPDSVQVEFIGTFGLTTVTLP